MNTAGVRDMLRAKHAEGPKKGEHKIPFIVVSDAFDSETVRFADLVLPDTTYLERHDAISMLDRPISEADTVADAIRHPVVALDRDVRPFQEVLVDLAGRLKFPAFTQEDGTPKYKDYPEFIWRYEKSPGIGFLAGFRGKDGEKSLKGEPNEKQWERYIENGAFFTHHWAPNEQWMRHWNRDYQKKAVEAGLLAWVEPIVMQIYSEPIQKFRLAGQGLYEGPTPPKAGDRERLVKYFDPLPDWYAPLDDEGADDGSYPLHAITQRPMMMYHSWDTQNVWLRQIMAGNFLYMNEATAKALGLASLDWVWVESRIGKIRCQLKTMEGVEANTVWTWNAIGKQSGAWGLEKRASESTHGFLLNHLISEHLPKAADERSLTNSDPITGQAAWYDLKVKVTKAAPGEEGVWPVFDGVTR